MRRLLTALGAGLGAAAAVAALRRRAGGRRSHVDLYFADGSMVSLPADAPASARLLPVARELLAAARGS